MLNHTRSSSQHPLPRRQAAGTTRTNEGVNLNEFCQLHILPELEKPDVNAGPVLKADCVKFLTTFRNQLPKEWMPRIYGRLAALLTAEPFVVHTYAATCTEKLLLVREAGGMRAPHRSARAPRDAAAIVTGWARARGGGACVVGPGSCLPAVVAHPS